MSLLSRATPIFTLASTLSSSGEMSWMAPVGQTSPHFMQAVQPRERGRM